MSDKENGAHLLDERRPFVILRFIVISDTVNIAATPTSSSTASTTAIFLGPDRFWRQAILIAVISIRVRSNVGINAGICSAIIIVLVIAASD